MVKPVNEPALTTHVFKIKGGKLWTLTQDYYNELKNTYPLHDVEGEMRAAKLWCKNVSACRRKTAKGMNRFLGGWISRSEASGYVTIDPEKSPSEIIYAKNLKEKFEMWSGPIKEWSPGKLKASKSFMAASQYPEFAEWALKEKPELKGAKPDYVVKVNEKVFAPKTPVPEQLKVDIKPVDKKQDAVELYREAVEYGKRKNPLLMKQ